MLFVCVSFVFGPPRVSPSSQRDSFYATPGIFKFSISASGFPSTCWASDLSSMTLLDLRVSLCWFFVGLGANSTCKRKMQTKTATQIANSSLELNLQLQSAHSKCKLTSHIQPSVSICKLKWQRKLARSTCKLK